MKKKFVTMITLVLCSFLFTMDVTVGKYSDINFKNISLNSNKEAVLISNKVESSNKTLDESSEEWIKNDDVNNLTEYKINSKIYDKNKVKIIYPQISSLSDQVKQKAINKLLEEEALDILKGYLQDDPKLKNVTLKMNYEVKLKNNKYISVAYSGYGNVKGTAHPLSLFYTTNIDVEEGKGIRLSDYADITKVLTKLKNLKTVKVVAKEEELAEAQKSALMEMNDDQLLKILKDTDFYVENGKIKIPENGGFSYMEENNIIVSLPVSHAIGDHAEFSVGR